MNNKFRDELIKLEYAITNGAIRGQDRQIEILMDAAKAYRALLSGTHETHWLAPKEPTEKMLISSQLQSSHPAKYYAMRDASQEERRG